MTYPRYPKYKDSGVEWLGEVPAHWEVKRFRHVFEIRKRICGGDGYMVLSITQNGIKPKDIESGDGQLSADYSKYQFVEVGDFAMNHMDLLTGYVDMSAYHGVTSPDYRVFASICKEACHDQFLLYILQSGYRNKIFFAFGQGSAQLGRWRLPTDEFKNFEFPCPSFQEQLEVARVLDHETGKIDSLIAQQQRLIALLKEKRQAVISHAVTKGLNPAATMRHSEIEWLGVVPADWNILPLKRDLVFLTSGSRGWAGQYADQGALFIRIGNLTRCGTGLDLSDIQRVIVPDGTEGERTRLQSGDLLFSITAYLGSVGVVPEDLEPAYVSQHLALARLRRRSLLPNWVAYFALSSAGQAQFDTQAYGGTKIQLSLDDIANLVVAIPPLSEQLEIVAYLNRETSRIDALIAETERAISLLQERRTALISAAVTGKIDVRDAASGAAA